MVLLCALWISNLGWLWMSVGKEQEEIAVFCRWRKSKLGFRESHPNYEVTGDPLVQVTPGCHWLFSYGLPGWWSLLQSWLVPFTGDSHWLKKLRIGPKRRKESTALSSCVASAAGWWPNFPFLCSRCCASWTFQLQSWTWRKSDSQHTHTLGEGLNSGAVGWSLFLLLRSSVSPLSTPQGI